MTKENQGKYIAGWKIKVEWFLRFIILSSGIFQTFFGETAIGMLTIIALIILTLPSFFTRGKIKSIPIEIEILLFIMVLVQFIIGEARDFYENVPYYDKFVHYLLPMFIGIIGFLLTYTLYYSGNLKISIRAMIFVVILLTIGIGAVWEIFEYTSDELIAPRIEWWHHFQGSMTEDPLHDTMNDLIADTLGAIMGAILCAFFIGREAKKENKRLPELLSELSLKK